MKKYLSIFILLMLFSCNSIFKDETNPYLNVNTYEEKVNIIKGIYAHILAIHDESYFVSCSRSDDVNVYGNYSLKHQYQSNYCRSSASSVDVESVVNGIYEEAYDAIININKLLTQLNGESDAYLLGEAHFLRGYLYFKLARLFGQPPLIDDYFVNYLAEKPSYTEVYNFIEEDLLNAIYYLPDTYTNARIPGETPHKGTAKALLAEVYLTMGGYPLHDDSKYALAAQYAGEVIDSAEYYGYGLFDDFADLWKNNRSLVNENVFGMYCSIDEYATSNKIAGISLVTYDSYYYTRSAYKPCFYFFDKYPDSYRKITTLTKGYYQFTDIEGNPTGGVFDLSNNVYAIYNLFDVANDPCDFMFYFSYTKWFDKDLLKRTSIDRQHSYNGSWFENNLYLLRYAHTLLTYAEAKARAGELDNSAYEAVNKIRRRAHKLAPDSPSEYDLANLSNEQFIDSVVWERAWELCLEPDGRWFDIIRLDLRDEVENAQYENDPYDVVPEDLLSDDWYFYLIPKEDRDVNPNY